MGGHPIENHADPLLVHVIDKKLKIVRRSKRLVDGKKSGHLIAPRFIQRMLQTGISSTWVNPISLQYLESSTAAVR